MIDRPLYLNKIMPYVDTPFVKILTGVRRCGKSTILKMIMKKLKEERNVVDEQILNYRFDSMEYEDMTTKELYLELKSKILQDKKMYLLAIFLLGFGIANLFRNLDFVHHIINLVGLALITFSLIFSKWERLKK